MTREEARKAAEILTAYADGKEIEFKVNGSNQWETGSIKKGGLFLDFNAIEYRIKQELIYRPFKDKDECWAEMQKHQPFGWIQEKNSEMYELANKIGGCPDEVDGLNYLLMFHCFNFADGTPFGIMEE